MLCSYLSCRQTVVPHHDDSPARGIGSAALSATMFVVDNVNMTSHLRVIVNSTHWVPFLVCVPSFNQKSMFRLSLVLSADYKKMHSSHTWYDRIRRYEATSTNLRLYACYKSTKRMYPIVQLVVFLNVVSSRHRSHSWHDRIGQLTVCTERPVLTAVIYVKLQPNIARSTNAERKRSVQTVL